MKKSLLLLFALAALIVRAQEKNTKALSKQELVTQSAASICDCFTKKPGGKSDDFTACIKEEIGKDQATVTAAYGDDMMKAIMGFMMDVTLQSMERCEQANKVLLEGRAANYKAVTSNCQGMTPVVGNYFYEAAYVGRTNVKFTENSYQELDSKGKETSGNKVVWNGCLANLIELKDGVFMKKGDTTKLLVRRASPDGFIGVVKMGMIQTLVEYRKDK